MPGISSLARAEELTRGTTPTPEEKPAADLLAIAGRLYDRLSGPAPLATAGTPERRPA